VQNKVVSDDADDVSVWDFAAENRDSADQDEQSGRQAAPVVSGWHDVKWHMKIWLLTVPQLYSVHTKFHLNMFCTCACSENAY
jgi:hypothetical protein